MRFDIGKRDNDNVVLNKGQEAAVTNLIDFIAAPFDARNNIQALCGAGGVGKTFVTKYVIDHCKFSSSMIHCAAPTHKACRVLSNATKHRVETIQKIFGFRLDVNIEDFDPNNPAFNPIGGVKITELNCRVLIIDEASMLNRALVNYISRYCARQKIKIIVIGDDSQLSPVNEAVSSAFKMAVKINRLTEIVRQDDDNPIRTLLDILRKDIKNKTYNFLTYINNHRRNVIDGKGYVVVGIDDFTELVARAFSNKDFEKNVDLNRCIAYTNGAVGIWNRYVRNSIIQSAEKSILNNNDLIMSYVTIVDEFNDIIINNSEDYIIRDILNFTDSDYGFKGFMVKFQAIHGGAITKPLFIINHTDQSTFITYCQEVKYLIDDAKAANKEMAASKWKKYFAFKRKYLILTDVRDNLGNIVFKRDIDYGFALTSHKSQGSTYKNVFVDVNDMVYDKNGHPYTDADDLRRRLYVACSRASNFLVLRYG